MYRNYKDLLFLYYKQLMGMRLRKKKGYDVTLWFAVIIK